MIYLLAIAVVLGSLTFYGAAFFHPEVHRKSDFVWSGVGLFYGLVLWFTADRATGTVLLGETASVTLLGWLGWQTWSLRQARSAEAARHATTPVSFNTARQSPASGSTSSASSGTTSAPPVAPPPPEPVRPPKVVVRPQLRRPRVYWDLDYEFVEDHSRELSLPAPAVEEAEATELEPLDLVIPEAESPEISAEPLPIASAGESPSADPPIDTPEMPEAESEALVDPAPVMEFESEAAAPDEAPQTHSAGRADELAVESEPSLETMVDPDGGAAPAPLQPSPPPPEAISPTPSPPVPQPQPQTGWLTKGVILKDWVIEVIGSLTKPKPTQPMIELPPRPRSIPRPEAVKPVQSEGEIAPDLDDWDDDGED